MSSVGDLGLADCLRALSSTSKEREAHMLVLARAVTAVSASGGLIFDGQRTRAAIGVEGSPPLATRRGAVELPGGRHGATVPIGYDGYLLVVRDQEIQEREIGILDGYGAALDTWLAMYASRTSERSSMERSNAQAEENARLLESLLERQQLLERLTRIQRSISHRAPLQEVLDAITLGANELLGDEVAAVRLVEPSEPDFLQVASVTGVPAELLSQVARTPIGEGAGGRAISENRLVIVYNYDHGSNVVAPLARQGLKSAMAAPVHEHGEAVGSLVVGTYRPDRVYSEEEQEALLAFAEHVSLALSDARTVEALREAQRVKEMFLAMVSHELKTPLTAIMGTLRTFERHDAALQPEVRAPMLAAAIERGEQLGLLINRLLQGARAELADVEHPITLEELVRGGTAGFTDAGPLVVAEMADVPLVVDVASAQGALGILLENALSHSPPGSEVHVTAAAVDHDVKITVSNVGELPSDLDPESLFLPFQRGPDPRSSGVGLGLYIASRLATAIGGRIDVGSTGDRVQFTLRFPLKLTSAAH